MRLRIRPFAPLAPLAALLVALAPLADSRAAVPPQETVEAILETIEDERDDADPVLYRRLAEIGTEESFEALRRVPGLLREEQNVRLAYEAFIAYAGLDELEQEALDFLLAETSERAPTKRRAAVHGLAMFEELAEDELEEVADDSPDAEAAAIACRALLPIWSAYERDGKLMLLLESARVPTTATLEELTRALDEWDRPQNDRVLCRALDSRDVTPRVKRAIVAAVVDRDHEEVNEALEDVLTSDDLLLVYRGLEALEARGATEHERRVKQLIGSEDDAVRRLAILSLARLNRGNERYVNTIERWGRSDHPATRQGAVAALALLDAPGASEAITDYLDDEDRLVRREAVRALVELRDRASVPVLIEQLGEETGRGRLEVARALRLLTGEDHGNSAERWGRWWDAEGQGFEPPSLADARALEEQREARESQGDTVASFYGLDVAGDRIAFVLDTSASMNEDQGGRTRMHAAKEELRTSLDAFPAGGWFNLVFFSSEVDPWRENLVRMDDFLRREALAHVDEYRAKGATAIYDALRYAFADREVDTIFLLTDGDPQGGTTDDPVEIREDVLRWNLTREVEIHCVSVGRSSELLRGLAEDSDGNYREVR